jgi:hypothetical protein
MVMALPPALADSVNNPAMIRAALPHEIRLLPQIESGQSRANRFTARNQNYVRSV